MSASAVMSQSRRTQFPAWVVVLILSALTIVTFSVLLIMGTLKILPEPPYEPEDSFVLYGLTAFNFVAFVIFAFILARLLIRLHQERRARRLGSRLKARLVRYFIVISILPLISLGFFSYLFINVTIDKWFGAPYQSVLHESQYIYDQYVQDDARDLRQMTQLLCTWFEDRRAWKASSTSISSPSWITQNPKLVLGQIVNEAGQVMVFYRSDSADLSALRSAVGQWRAELLAGRPFTRTMPGQQEKDFLLINGVPFKTHRGGILTVYRPLPELAERAANIARQHDRYEVLHRHQGKIRRTTFQVLGLITFLLLFAATWTASHLAKGITLPVQALAEATRKVARGDFDHSVDCPAEDELDLLVRSFNRMMGQLKESRQQLEATAECLRQTNLTLEERRRYIETVLESLSTGIISVDAGYRLTTINRAAIHMLQLQPTPPQSVTIAESLTPVLGEDNTQRILRLLRRAARTGFATEDLELNTLATVSHLVVSASALRDEQGCLQGLVIMLEDVTELVRAQRQAVWSEVARRLAHEIKNPLTPIQLSAERIARNLKRQAPALDEKSQQIIDECVRTIVGEVHTLQRMVNEFARFARLPQARLEEASLNQIVEAALKLYEDRLNGVILESCLADDLPRLLLDAEQIKRVLVNLIDNALEAVRPIDGERRITVQTHYLRQHEMAQLVVSDTGVGIDPQDYPRLFTPYFSKRAHGTGLGLAIVSRIVAEHHGKVYARPNRPRGTQFIVELPLVSSTAAQGASTLDVGRQRANHATFSPHR